MQNDPNKPKNGQPSAFQAFQQGQPNPWTQGQQQAAPGYGPPRFETQTTTSVRSPFGNFGNINDYHQHQDAFAQQFRADQIKHNQSLFAGQQSRPVDLGDTWKQAGENIKSGAYQGNPFATGNVDALMGLFGQYGIPVPTDFQEQLMRIIGQQSPPSMYPQPGAGIPAIGQRPQAGLENNWGFNNPLMPDQQQSPGMTSFPVGPNGEYWPGFNDPRPGMGQQPALFDEPGVYHREVQPFPAQPAPQPPAPDAIKRFPTMLPIYGITPQPPAQQPPASGNQPPRNPYSEDQWSYELRPGHVRNPDGSQRLDQAARDERIKEMEARYGRTYVPPKPGVTHGGWLDPAPPRRPTDPMSIAREQAAALMKSIGSKDTEPGKAQPKAASGSGTPYKDPKTKREDAKRKQQERNDRLMRSWGWK